jgi:hypothetical protein
MFADVTAAVVEPLVVSPDEPEPPIPEVLIS